MRQKAWRYPLGEGQPNGIPAWHHEPALVIGVEDWSHEDGCYISASFRFSEAAYRSDENGIIWPNNPQRVVGLN